jgi:peroxiredoxin
MLIFAIQIYEMIRFIIHYFLLGAFLFSCSNEEKQGTAFITGSIPELGGQWIYLEELEVKKLVKIDSVRVDQKGKFEFNIRLNEPAFYMLQVSYENRLTLLLDKNEKVEIKCQTKSFADECQIQGSPGSILLLDFEQFMMNQKRRIDSLAEVFYAYEDNPDFLKKKVELDSIYTVIVENQRNYVTEFVDKNPGSLASLLVINRKLGNSKVLDEEEDFIYFHRIDSALMISYPNNMNTIDHHNRVEEVRGKMFDRFTADEKLKPGKRAPNIVVKDTNDQLHSLKSLTGKKVLICFWAGWNAKSRQDNRKLVDLYPTFSNKNLEVFGVSLDENAVIWKGAVKLDRLPGIQGSDLKGMRSEVMKDYNLPDQLPFYYLIDEDQKIIYRDKDFSKIIEQL